MQKTLIHTKEKEADEDEPVINIEVIHDQLLNGSTAGMESIC